MEFDAVKNICSVLSIKIMAKNEREGQQVRSLKTMEKTVKGKH